MSLPALFIGLAGVTLVLALMALWQSLRVVFGAPNRAASSAPLRTHQRRALLDEKVSLLRSIKELTFDKEVGKVSDEDFQRLNADYRARAKRVLRELDQDLEPFIGEAEALVSNALAIASEKRSADSPAPLAKGECPKCGTRNDEDARFCKHCASPLSDDSAADTPRPAPETAES